MSKEKINCNVLSESYIADLYKDISGFVSYKPGEKEAHAKKNIFLTYGEILYSSVEKIIAELVVTQHDVFYDLGSGVGKVPLHFFLKTPIIKSCGIEASLSRHQFAETIYQKVNDEFPKRFENERTLLSQQGNFLETDISDATIIYTCSTCFSDELLAKLGNVFNQCPNLKYVISMKMIDFKLKLKQKLDIECSWDKSKCYVYAR